MVQKYHQYSSAVPYFQDAAEPGIPELDQFRLQSYGLYEQFYWNHPESYRLLQRGEDEAPLYLPTPKQIVEATNRFLAKNFDFTVGKETGTENDQSMLDQTIRDFLKRERFWPKFNAQRRYGLVRGDAVWHITADDTKPELTRISLHALHPSRYFAITDPNDPEHVIGAHLVDVSPLSTLGALCLASAPAAEDRAALYRKLLSWGLSMSVVGAVYCYVVFGLLRLY